MDLRRAPLIVAAVGGNALLRRGEAPDLATQVANVRVAVDALARVAAGARLAITHGNGPQVGVLATDAAAGDHPVSLDVLDAETQGQIGYLLVRELGNVLHDRPVVGILTQVVVDGNDPAFAVASKPIGPMLDQDTARRMATERGWSVAPDTGGWRRVVASPAPVAVLETPMIQVLLDAGAVVVCAGGGGIPTTRGADGHLVGVEAVVDKDLTSALLAQQLGAERLLLLTDVDAVQDGWGTDAASPIGHVRAAELRARTFAPGSMGPKVEAACRFAEAGGTAVIGSLADAFEARHGRAGTVVTAPRTSRHT